MFTLNSTLHVPFITKALLSLQEVFSVLANAEILCMPNQGFTKIEIKKKSKKNQEENMEKKKE